MSKEAVKELIRLIKSGEVKVEQLTKEFLESVGISTCSNGEIRRLVSNIKKAANVEEK
jgi:hypothetical protein